MQSAEASKLTSTGLAKKNKEYIDYDKNARRNSLELAEVWSFLGARILPQVSVFSFLGLSHILKLFARIYCQCSDMEY